MLDMTRQSHHKVVVLLAIIMTLISSTYQPAVAFGQFATPVAPAPKVEVPPTQTTAPTVEATPAIVASPGSSTIEPTELLDDVLKLITVECDPLPDASIGRGTYVSTECRLKALATLDLELASLDATISATYSPDVITRMSGLPECPGALVSVCALKNIKANLFTSPIRFTVTINPECAAHATDAIHTMDVSASLTLSALDSGVLTSTKTTSLPFTISNTGSTGPHAVITSQGAHEINFGEFTWNGSAYQPASRTRSLDITISPPETGCLAPGSTVDISGNAQLTSTSNPDDTIPNDAFTLVVGTAPTGFWGIPVTPDHGFLPNLPQPIFVTSDTSGTDSAVINLDFSLTPPSTAPPGTYTGTITITSAPPAP